MIETKQDERAAAAADAPQAPQAPQWVAVCRVDEIPRLGARRVRRAQGAEVAVFRAEGDAVFALLDRCPHKGGPLSQGIVFGRSVGCPLHQWTIGLADGQAQAPDVGCTPRFSVRVEAGMVLLDASELASHAIAPLPPARACGHAAPAR